MSKIVVVSPDGVVIDAEEYDPAQPGREERIAAAVAAIAERLGVEQPRPFKISFVDDEGREWLRTTVPIEIGMVEIGVGKWGYPSADH